MALIPVIFADAAGASKSVLLSFAVLILAALPVVADPFVRTSGDQLVLNGAPFAVAGINNHYLPWGSPQEVTRVLDAAVAMHANVVRTIRGPVIGAPDNSVPTMWNFHNDQLDSSDLNVHGTYLLYWNPATQSIAVNTGANGMQKIDFLIAEAAKRHLRLILAFIDFWPFAGGTQQMRAWYGSADQYSFFFTDARTNQDYMDWVRSVIDRRNTLTGVVYRDDPTIMAWELMNEPEAPLWIRDPWMSKMSSYVKSLDPNHLVTTGEDRLNKADYSMASVDFLTWHGYPIYYGVSPQHLDDKISESCAAAKMHGKPVLLEEFGYARSNTGPDQAQTYKMWLDSLRGNPDCAGWLVWRLVARQDDEAYPPDPYDQFDVHEDGGATWQVLAREAQAEEARAGQ
jgi:mannan endo-1,4-beta-mannosidase